MPLDESGVAGGRAEAPTPALERPGVTMLIVTGPIEPGDVADLCERGRALVPCGEGEVRCDVGGLAEPDVAAIDALARLQLTAIRLGRRVRLRHACDRLQDLVGLVGLREVLPSEGSGIQTGRQPEEWEQVGGVEEERDRADPAV